MIANKFNEMGTANKSRNCRLECEFPSRTALNSRIWPSHVAATLTGDRGAQRPITIGTNVQILTKILVDCRIFEKIGAWKFSFQTTVPTPTGAFLSPKSNVTPGLEHRATDPPVIGGCRPRAQSARSGLDRVLWPICAQGAGTHAPPCQFDTAAMGDAQVQALRRAQG